MSIVYLNGEYTPVEMAHVSVLDRGFTFADAIYEVIPVYGDHIFRVQEHLNRLDNCLSEIYIKNPYSGTQWIEIFSQILEKNEKNSDRILYVQVTRGVGERVHLDDSNLTPTVFVMCKPLAAMETEKGVDVITHEDIRWKYCHIKATALLANVLLKKRAREADGCIETILVKNDHITEGAASNVFVVKDAAVITPRKDGSVLPGITRDLIVELLQQVTIPCSESSISLEDLRNADEVWLTSSTMGIMPVVRIDNKNVADGKPGRVWEKANRLFQEFKNNPTSIQ